MINLYLTEITLKVVKAKILLFKLILNNIKLKFKFYG